MPARLLQATFFLLSYIPISCAVQSSATKHLTVLEATERTWKPGIVKNNTQRSGGKIYDITLSVRESGRFKFQSLTVGQQMLDVQLKEARNENLVKGDTVRLVARTDVTKAAPAASERNLDIIKNDSAQAVVDYEFESVSFSLPIHSFSKKTSQILNP